MKKKHPFYFWFAIFFGVVMILACAFYLYISYLLPLPNSLQDLTNHPTTKIFDRNGQLLYEILQPELGKKSTIPLKQFPKYFIDATIAAEDINFYSHPGVDFGAIARALFFNLKEQRIVSGGSTITQQLVRNLMAQSGVQSAQNLQKPRDLGDKILEAMYAVRMSHLYNKDQILEQYLNKIYYGNLAYGAQSAALDYFGKNIFDLDLAQSAIIAGLPQSPSSYNPYVYFDKAKQRQKYVLEQMVKNNFASQAQADSALAEPINLRVNKFQIKAPHFVHLVLNQLEEKYGEDAVINGGLQIRTTLDYDLQLKAEQIITRRVDALKENNVQNGALVAMDTYTGQILAWVGSKDYFDNQIDGAVDMITALRQPGSSIKPLNYLAAFEKGYTPATVLYDIPTQFSTETGPYSPKNYDLKYHGPVRARVALASSFNIPAVKVLDYVGVNNFLIFLKKLGIETLDASPSFYGLALTLGGGEVRPIDMANAFNVIANYGLKRDSSDILEIKDADGAEIFKWKLPEAKNILGAQGMQHAYQIIDILKDPSARIAGFGEDSVLQISHESAVKTGTTRNFKDNWTIGFSPEILTAVWVGNADATSMENVSGVDGAAPIWADFMESALESKPKLTFAVPPNLVEKQVCALSGKLPNPGSGSDYGAANCPEKVNEIFARGQEPKELDDYYKLFWVRKSDGHIIMNECVKDYNPAEIQQKVLVAYPAELQKWAGQNSLGLAKTEPCAKAFDYSNGSSSNYPVEQAAAVLIDSPNNNDEYQLDSSLPLSAQKTPFRVSVPNDTVEVNYFVDDKVVADVKEPPFSYLWLAVLGNHKLRAEAKLADGRILKSTEIVFDIK